MYKNKVELNFKTRDKINRLRRPEGHFMPLKTTITKLPQQFLN